MGDDIWEYYAKDMMFESHKEPHYVTQQYIKHLEKERDKWRKLADDLIWAGQCAGGDECPCSSKCDWVIATGIYREAVRGE